MCKSCLTHAEIPKPGLEAAVLGPLVLTISMKSGGENESATQVSDVNFLII